MLPYFSIHPTDTRSLDQAKLVNGQSLLEWKNIAPLGSYHLLARAVAFLIN